MPKVLIDTAATVVFDTEFIEVEIGGTTYAFTNAAAVALSQGLNRALRIRERVRTTPLRTREGSEPVMVSPGAHS